jgi:hypothetical protein
MPYYTPLDSPIKSIFLGGINIIPQNDICRFEKIEFTESVFDLFPTGCLVVRDLNDVVSYVNNLSAGDPTNKNFTITYDNGNSETFYINGTVHLNNAASETEENFIGINFTNKLFLLNQNLSVTNLLKSSGFPQVYNIETFYSEMVAKIKQNSNTSGIDAPKLTNLGSRKFSNVIAYRPINPLEGKTDEASENPIQYMNYISSLACDSNTSEPRFLFWTGFNNNINLKYFSENIASETVYGYYGVYQQDVPSMQSAGALRKKIYVLTTSPAYQYLNRQYYYTRKTPKLLNKPEPTSTTSNETILMNHQFLDDGTKYDIEFVVESGVVDNLSGTIGLSSLEYTNHYGYYNKNDTFTPYGNSTLLGMEYGVSDVYANKDIMGVVAPYPFIDNPEMWKNMWDMTPVHPNIGTSITGSITATNTNLQKVFQVRESSKTSTSKLEKIKEIELQNFVYYVLCCLKEPEIEQEETFFACITGWQLDITNPKLGVNNEPLIYRYAWKRIGVNLLFNSINFNNFTNPELSPWDQMDEGSDSEDIETYAINLNERKNSTSGDISSRYYAPGWYTQNLTEPVFEDSVTYRPIGNRGGDLNEFEEGTTCLHIVMMRKIPFIQIALNAKNYADVIGIDQQKLLEYIEASKGKYLYCFELSNVTDGKCNPIQ